jgi:hypothetical protein
MNGCRMGESGLVRARYRMANGPYDRCGGSMFPRILTVSRLSPLGSTSEYDDRGFPFFQSQM